MRKSLVVALVTIVVLAALGVGAWQAYQALYQRFTPEVCTVEMGGDEFTTLSAEQARNASIIVAASVQRGLPERAAVIAIATAYQESGLRNLDYGDRDSLGLFQQRPSYGWGTEEQIMDPWYSSNRFYEELVKFTDWETTDVNDIAQKVQRSGFPEAYRKHVAKSEAVAGALRGSSPASLSCLNFEAGPANEDALLPVLEAFGQALTVDRPDAPTLVVTAQDETTMWAAAQHIVANSYDAGVTQVVAADKQWQPGTEGWRDARTPQATFAVAVTLG